MDGSIDPHEYGLLGHRWCSWCWCCRCVPRALQGGAVWPVLCALGKEPNYIGPVGTAAAVKLSLNQLIASLTVGAGQGGRAEVMEGTSSGAVRRGGACMRLGLCSQGRMKRALRVCCIAM